MHEVNTSSPNVENLLQYHIAEIRSLLIGLAPDHEKHIVRKQLRNIEMNFVQKKTILLELNKILVKGLEIGYWPWSR